MRRESAIPNVAQLATEKCQTHPSSAQLEAFGLGQMTGAESALLEEHVAACETCYEVLRGLPDDTLMSALRSGAAGATPGLRAHSPLAQELAEHSRYRVLELLGSGGMGAVYKAEHRLMQRPVALKIIHRYLVERPAAVERFRREVKAAARLCHPNIVTAHDAEQAGDTHFLVMEYVKGTSLVHVVQEHGTMPVGKACTYIRQAALGLQHAHEHGMVHRDIKPHNLMLTPVGQIKILDFGLAHFAEAGEPADARHSGDTALDVVPSALTQASTVMGTPDYMAPEQTTSGRSVDIRSDIYSLGCTLYFLLTARPPFPDGTLGEKLAAQRERQPRPLRDIRPEVPPALAQVVARMMAKDPAQRYQTPGEVARALSVFESAKRVSARRSRAVLAASITLIAVSGFAAAFLFGFIPGFSFRTNDNSRGDPPAGERPTRASAVPSHFAPQVSYAVGVRPYAVAVGDLNGDGKQDLVVSNIYSDTVSVLLGNGDGTFQPAIPFAVGEQPHGVVLADLNGDGKLDLAVANLMSNTVSILLGNGDGTFQPPMAFAAGPAPRGLAVGDFNGDGKPDLVVANWQAADTVSVLLGNGDGTFGPAVSYPSLGSPISVAVADLNGDGKQDLVVANGARNTVGVLLGNGDGTFQPAVYYAVGSGPGAVVVGDFHGDGIADIAVENVGSNDVSVLLGKGDGTFQAVANYPAGIGPGGLTVGDFNGDGVSDLAVANHHSNDVSVLLGKGDGTFRPAEHFAAGWTPAGIASGQFKVHDRTDVVVVNHMSDNVSVLLGQAPQPHFRITAPYRVGRGEVFYPDITALDAGNNIDVGYTGSVWVRCSQAVPPNRDYVFKERQGGTSHQDIGVQFVTAGAQTLTVTDTVSRSRLGTVTVIVVTGPPSRFRVSAPLHVEAGEAFKVTVAALDDHDCIACEHDPQVHFTSSDAGALLPADFTFERTNRGLHRLAVTLKTAGRQTITVTDVTDGAIKGSATVEVHKGKCTAPD